LVVLYGWKTDRATIYGLFLYREYIKEVWRYSIENDYAFLKVGIASEHTKNKKSRLTHVLLYWPI
jgi:hypothetical protein